MGGVEKEKREGGRRKGEEKWFPRSWRPLLLKGLENQITFCKCPEKAAQRSDVVLILQPEIIIIIKNKNKKRLDPHIEFRFRYCEHRAVVTWLQLVGVARPQFAICPYMQPLTRNTRQKAY